MYRSVSGIAKYIGIHEYRGISTIKIMHTLIPWAFTTLTGVEESFIYELTDDEAFTYYHSEQIIQTI